jgi:FAD/FMN-containing dehydrogenase
MSSVSVVGEVATVGAGVRLAGLAQVVLADGRIVDCDQQHHPELFWALRGAVGGNFGVVTSLVFRTVPAPRSRSSG